MNDPTDLLTIEQAAEFLNVSETSLRRWTNDGRLPCARIGKKRIRRFKRQDLIDFLDMETSFTPASARAKHTFIGGIAVEHGSHLCSFYTTPSGRTKLAISFIADGLQQDCACLLLCTPQASEELLTQLRHYRPGYKRDMAAGRLVIEEYLKTPAEQLERLEQACKAAIKTGAKTIRLVGDVSHGRLAAGNAFSIVTKYERALEEKIAKKYPLVTLCQYDAGRHDGAEMVEVMKLHRDVFCYPPERLLN